MLDELQMTKQLCEEKNFKLKTAQCLIDETTAKLVEIPTTAIMEKEESLTSQTLKTLQTMATEITLLRQEVASLKGQPSISQAIVPTPL